MPLPKQKNTGVMGNSSQEGIRTALISIFVNLLLAAIKVTTGIVGNSYALIADGIESLMDIFSSLVVWGGLTIGALPPDENHPYGHGKAESLAAMFVALTLMGVAVGIAVQCTREIFNPHQAPKAYTLLVLALVILTKEMLFRFVFKTGQRLQSLSLKGDAWHHRSDALTSLAAFLGISIALLAGKGYESADDWAALFACGIIGFNGLRLLKSAIGEIMDEAVEAHMQQRIRDTAQKVAHVHAIEKCRIRKSGVGFFVEIHVEVDGKTSLKEAHRIGHEVKDAIQNAGLGVLDAVVHMEPATE